MSSAGPDAAGRSFSGSLHPAPDPSLTLLRPARKHEKTPLPRTLRGSGPLSSNDFPAIEPERLRLGPPSFIVPAARS
jgi:hypothetical protein